MVQLKNQVLEALSDPSLPAEPVLMFDLRQSVSVQERSTDEVRDMAEFLAAHAEQFSSRIGMVPAREWLTSTKGAE
jgi:hypothetical protein